MTFYNLVIPWLLLVTLCKAYLLKLGANVDGSFFFTPSGMAHRQT